MAALQVGAATDVGMVRTVNEDRFLVDEALFAVADGLGGHQAGEVASKTAVETLSREFHQATVDGLVEAAKAANRAVYQLAANQPELQGMATTLTAVALVEAEGERRLAVANVGDSRAYLLQRGEMMQLTEDHSLVEQLVREGRLTAQEALVHPQRSVITRALGLDPDVEIDSWQILPYEGDRLLLCSDGLTNEVSDSDIAGILRRTDDPEDAARQLVDRARTHGGNDNITVVVIDVVDDEGRAEKASAALASEGGGGKGDAGGATTPAPAAFSPMPAADGPVGRGAQTRTAVRPPPSGPAPAPGPATGSGGSGLSWRMVLFVFGLVAVLAVAASAVGWYARSTYYVGLQDDRVVIFKGRPGGLLWFAPTVEQRTRLRATEVPPARLPDIQAGQSEPNLAGAQRYVASLREEAAAQEARRREAQVSPPTSSPPPPPGVP